MDQRIGVNHLDGGGDLRSAAAGHPEQPSAGQHQERPQPLAGGERGIAHRLVNPRLKARWHDQQTLDHGVGQPGRDRTRFGH